MKLDKNSFVPLYYQLAEIIREDIVKERLRSEDLISENELIQKFRISRGTVREALRILSDEGLVRKERGRGTFVTSPAIEQENIKEIGFFSKAMLAKGIQPSAKVLQACECTAPKYVKNLLNLETSDQVVLIQRLRYADNQVVALESEYYQYEIGKQLLEKDLHASIYKILQEELNCIIHHSKVTIEAVIADEDEAENLDIEECSPVLKISRVIYLPDNFPLSVSTDVFRADKIKFGINVKHQEYDENLNISPIM